ncbi:Mu transposase C-terminal domain-containing protein [Nocardia rhamnosiphila]|uniref:Mu transposase C-terminal domain-containing protein n=1 Tax=Nocardia rhamnosiphila TaxID=426716 RepID=UPI0033D908E7
MDRLVLLSERGGLSSGHVRLVAQTLGVNERSVWRWISARKRRVVPVPRGRFRIDDRLRVRLAYWRGNAAALQRELVEEQQHGGPAAPSVSTVQRAMLRDLTPGERAGLREGERERRKFDVFLQRPATHRNDAWESDHVEAPVHVDVDGVLVKPWVTWFVDATHDVILGAAVTPQTPSRESILAALRASILRSEPFGPAGGLPVSVRIDRGKDFLSRTVAEALGAFAVRVVALPPYQAHLKGTVEAINGAAETMLFSQLPRYTHRQTQLSGTPADPGQPALRFEAFVAEVLEWIRWWNEVHTVEALGGLTPWESWQQDPTPIHDVDEAKLWMFTLEDDRRERRITTKGVAFGRGRHYVAAWMVGLAGTAVRVRYMPNHRDRIEVFDARTGTHLGSAELADQANPETRRQVRRARDAKARRLRADMAAAEAARRIRYAAATVPEPPARLDTLTNAEARGELFDEQVADMARWARPDLITTAPPPPNWKLPVDLDAVPRHREDEDICDPGTP